MDSFGQRLRRLREERDITQIDLAKALSLANSTISQYEANRRTPDPEILRRVADYFGVSVDYLLCRTDNPHNTYLPRGAWPVEKTTPLPILGIIRAGEPIYAEQHIEGYFPFPTELLPCPEGKYFLLRVRGDSMIDAGIKEDNLVLVKEQGWLDENGDIMVVIINREDATVKRVYKQDRGLYLQPENKNYQPIFIPQQEMEEVRLVGKVIKVIADVK